MMGKKEIKADPEQLQVHLNTSEGVASLMLLVNAVITTHNHRNQSPAGGSTSAQRTWSEQPGEDLIYEGNGLDLIYTQKKHFFPLCRANLTP